MSDVLDTNSAACILLSYFPGIGPHLYDELVRVLGNTNSILTATKKDLEPVLKTRTSAFLQFRNMFDTDEKMNELSMAGIEYIARTSSKYPKQLITITDPPIGLFCKGNPNVWHSTSYCAVVGSRMPTSYGLRATSDIVKVLVQSGVGIVSGMALGIDAQAHSCALERSGKTIAVLGCGVDIVYPQQNKYLYDKIIKNGAVISEFPPGMFAKKGMFIARNRVIAALSTVVLCIEGHKHSGALITARYAAEQGRDVAALPGSIYNNLSQASHILLREGALPISKPDDVMEFFGRAATNFEDKVRVERQYNENEQQILSCIGSGGTTDYVVRASGLSSSKVITELSSLELEGVISRDDTGQWIYTNNPS